MLSGRLRRTDCSKVYDGFFGSPRTALVPRLSRATIMPSLGASEVFASFYLLFFVSAPLPRLALVQISFRVFRGHNAKRRVRAPAYRVIVNEVFL